MKRTTRFIVVSLSLALVFFSASSTWAEMDFGDYTISGSAEVDGLPMGFSGDRSRFENYRDIPETAVVPQLEFFLGTKKQDFYLNFDAQNVGLDNQYYLLRFGRYGLLDVELEWNQIPVLYNVDNARTPYIMNGGTYTLRSRPTADDPVTFSNWINDPNNTRSVNLKFLDQIGKISIRYTPTPGWIFSAKYWPDLKDGKWAIAFPFGNGPTSASGSSSALTELAQPIDYQTHNIELGGQYAGKDWSLGVKYNGSLFYNDTSTLVFDNPAAVGPNCVDSTQVNFNTGIGPCRGRADLYPNNQAHTFTLTGTAKLPMKTYFLGTVSYGWRLQNDSFLPFTINSCYAGGPCLQALQAMPTLSRGSLQGDKRPAMVNLSLVNNFVDKLNLKAYYRFYSLDNRTSPVHVTNGRTVRNDFLLTNDWETANLYSYSTNTGGVEAGYRFARWLNGKFNYIWQRTHRSINNIEGPNEHFNADEFKIGPTVDMTPLSWLLFRASYQHSWRFDPGYHGEATGGGNREQFWLAKRNQDKVSLFTDVSPWETLSFHAGFDYTNDNYPEIEFGVHNVQDVSPSIGFVYMPAEWVKFFADYNYDRYNWSQRYNSTITSRGKDKVNTFSLGMDMDVIKNVLTGHIEYQFSQGSSNIDNKNVADPQWPASSNTWQQLLARLEYQVHKNIFLQIGYYFNKYHSKDFGVDIMQLWMGNFDNNTGQLRSVYLGNQFKGSYTAHVGLVGLKFKF